MTETKDKSKTIKIDDRASNIYRAHLRELLRHGWGTLEFHLGEFQVTWTGNMEMVKEITMFLLMMTDKINSHIEKMPEVEDAYEAKRNGPTDPAIK